MLFALLLAIAAVVAGAIAAVAGFGIGSLPTPVLALETGTKLAVAAVAIRTSSPPRSGSGCCDATWIGASSSVSRAWRARPAGSPGPYSTHAFRAAHSPSSSACSSSSPRSPTLPAGSRTSVATRRLGRRCSLGSTRRSRRQPGRHPVGRLARLRCAEAVVRGNGHGCRAFRGCGAAAGLPGDAGRAIAAVGLARGHRRWRGRHGRGDPCVGAGSRASVPTGARRAGRFSSAPTWPRQGGGEHAAPAPPSAIRASAGISCGKDAVNQDAASSGDLPPPPRKVDHEVRGLGVLQPSTRASERQVSKRSAWAIAAASRARRRRHGPRLLQLLPRPP